VAAQVELPRVADMADQAELPAVAPAGWPAPADQAERVGLLQLQGLTVLQPIPQRLLGKKFSLVSWRW